MSSHENSNKNPFGPPPSIFDNSGSHDHNPPAVPLNHLFSPLQPPSSCIYSSTTGRSAVDASNEWGAPPQSQTQPLNPSSTIPPPPPPPAHLLQQRHPPTIPQHHNSFNIRPPPPPPPPQHHEPLALPQMNPGKHSVHSHNHKKRKRPPAAKSERNVKRRVDDSSSSKFDYPPNPRNYHKNSCKYARKRNAKRSRSRSRSVDRHKSRKHNRSRSRSPRARTRSRSTERRKYRARYRKNDDDDDDFDKKKRMKKRYGEEANEEMKRLPPPKPPTPPMPTMKREKERGKKLDVITDATEYLQNIGFTVHGFARHVFALAPLQNFGEDLVFPMNKRMKRDDFAAAFVLSEERKRLCESVQVADEIMSEVSENIDAYIAAALKDNDENSMRIMHEVNMKKSSANREIMPAICELKIASFNMNNSGSGIEYKYLCNENVLCWHEDHLYSGAISKRVAMNKSARYMVHYDGWNKAWDEWVAEDRILPKTAQNIQLMKSMDLEQEQQHKPRSVAPVNNIHNINMNTMKRMAMNEIDASSDETDTATASATTATTSCCASIPTMNINVSNINTNTTTNNIISITQNQALRENFVLKQEVINLRNEMKKYAKKAQRYRELKQCAKRLYSECVHGEGPRWHLIEFRDTEHRVTRDAELADLRTQICSLYAAQKEEGRFDVVGIEKWCGQKEIEQSVKKYVTANGEYSVEAATFIDEIAVDLRDVLEKFSITSHRIQALNGQHGIRLKMDVAKHTCFGQYFGGEISQNAFGKVFDGTGEEHDHNIYAFDQKIDKNELRKLGNENEDIPNKIFIIDPFIGDWKNDELLLRYVNDCRADIDDLQPSIEDQKYYNVEFVGMKVNGWPQTYLVAKRDIKKGEELMTFYGTDFSNAIAMKLEEEHKKKLRKHRIDRDILKGIKL